MLKYLPQVVLMQALCRGCFTMAVPMFIRSSEFATIRSAYHTDCLAHMDFQIQWVWMGTQGLASQTGTACMENPC